MAIPVVEDPGEFRNAPVCKKCGHDTDHSVGVIGYCYKFMDSGETCHCTSPERDPGEEAEFLKYIDRYNAHIQYRCDLEAIEWFREFTGDAGDRITDDQILKIRDRWDGR